MSDYLNEDVPVSDPNDDGNYRWLAVKAGGYSSFSKPIDASGGFLFNRVGDASIMYEMVKSSTTTPSANWVACVPNVAGNSLQTLVINSRIDNFVASGANIGTFRFHLGANSRVRVWIEAIVQSLSIAGDADQYSIGLFEGVDAPTAFAGGNIAEATRLTSNEPVVPSTTTVTRSTSRDAWSLLTTDQVTNDQYLCLCIKNMTSNARGLLIKYLKVVVNSYLF